MGRRSPAILRRTGLELLDAVFPRRCHLCGAAARDAFACDDHALAPAPLGPRCGRCAIALPTVLRDGSPCPDCRRRGPGFRRVVALADYHRQPACRDWILALKHGGRADLARPLGTALGRRLLEAGGDLEGALLVPVPLHPLRRLARGFDQARLLARAVESVTGLALAPVLRRRRSTPPQGAPGAVSRAANVRGAFVPRRGARARVGGREVWLVDDVVTSGATASACARALRRAGVRGVSILCAARAGMA